MIITRKDKLGCLNEITQYLDKYLILDHEWNKSYIYEKPIGNTWLIRVPGATVDNFTIKNNKVESIHLFEYDCFYKLKYYDKSVLKNIDQFIGKKIIFETN